MTGKHLTRIRELRVAKRWTQEKLAEESGLSRKTIERAEGGTRVAVESVRRIADALGVTLNEITATNPPDDASLEAYKKGNLPEALERFRARAEAGDATAQFNLGVMHYRGEGTAKDDVEAAQWMRCAAEQGFALAQVNLGTMYEKGEGVEKNAAKAVHWYRSAAEQGHPLGRDYLGSMYHEGEMKEVSDGVLEAYGKGNVAEALRLLRDKRTGVMKVMAHPEGSASVMKERFDAAMEAYEKGNLPEALEGFRACTEAGDAIAQYNLGVMYHGGEGTAKDDIEAARWMRCAAEQGLAPAQVDLGTMYDKGEGVEKNAAKAVHWYRSAAEQDFPLGQYYLGCMYHKGEGVAHDEAEANRWNQCAADQGLVVAELYSPLEIEQVGNGDLRVECVLKKLDELLRNIELIRRELKSKEYVDHKGEGVAHDEAEANRRKQLAADREPAIASFVPPKLNRSAKEIASSNSPRGSWTIF